ncbi:30S ribosomal protein S1 [bacterium CG_4_10_14_0_2_um_filter_33_32]|nr:MAG: 30S ribosomal protein S1 [bacterium CG06_land_8_20_14_3_00_33_50]PIW81168.1 MAG: 30S ribosomal protein S1 [bacterium CG_4_8_14_3_um_filter_33_28]PIY85417.1 MAG: 30S ribosomal protein S1 [bacterium CG_4_10_14_0_8_um_filter_33_57]PIZ85209.1 MAG: 30S ribosomal protein S1 [bacterium CG_4_10_14_0_2_um_filter_33_32]PJA71809.1 MAG: 30S ribosomal protein S1 [bacterium CG_4_9_14_3_um_filter_33_26]
MYTRHKEYYLETKELANTERSIFEEALLCIEKIEVGKVLEGTVIDLRNNEIWVDLDGRATGVVYKRELGDRSSIIDLAKGDRVLTYVLEEEDEDGLLVLSLKKAGKERVWTDLKRSMEKSVSLEVRITDANKGGLLVMIEGVQGFIPVSQLTAEYYPRVEGGDKEEILSRLTSLISKSMLAKVIDIDRASNKLILSQKATKTDEQKKFLDGLDVGQKIKGRISGVVDFGVFVNIGDIEGLVHISEASWERIDDIRKIVKVGDEIDVIIVEIDEDKVSLSIKRLLPDPFKEAIKQFNEGDIVKGKVVKVTPFGAFVQVETHDKKNLIDGLVHISELSDEHVSNPKDVIKEKEVYNLKIISIEEENRKLSLSLREVEEKAKVKTKSKEKERV